MQTVADVEEEYGETPGCSDCGATPVRTFFIDRDSAEYCIRCVRKVTRQKLPTLYTLPHKRWTLATTERVVTFTSAELWNWNDSLLRESHRAILYVGKLDAKDVPKRETLEQLSAALLPGVSAQLCLLTRRSIRHAMRALALSRDTKAPPAARAWMFDHWESEFGGPDSNNAPELAAVGREEIELPQLFMTLCKFPKVLADLAYGYHRGAKYDIAHHQEVVNFHVDAMKPAQKRLRDARHDIVAEYLVSAEREAGERLNEKLDILFPREPCSSTAPVSRSLSSCSPPPKRQRLA
jgi:hypothetical protein